MKKERSPFNRSQPSFKAQARADGDAEILVYDEIGFWGINAKTFASELKAIGDVETIHLRINSPGGSVFDGLAIFNMLRDHKAKVVTHIDGLAASIASIIALAGDEVHMAANAFFMIHNPWTITMGDSEQLRKDAAVLDKIGDQLLATYARRVEGKSETEIQQWMDDETWFNAEEAESAGFVDQIEGASNDAAKVANAFDLSVFSNAPAAIAAGASSTPTKRDVERVLRDAGLSRSEAKAFAASGWHALEAPRDADVSEFISSANRLIATLTTP